MNHANLPRRCRRQIMATRNGNAPTLQQIFSLRIPNIRDNRRQFWLLAAGCGIEADEAIDGSAGYFAGEEEEKGCEGGGGVGRAR